MILRVVVEKQENIDVEENTSTPSLPVVARPLGYARIWSDKGSRGKNDGSIWRPLPPDGYLSLGDVAAKGYDTLSVDKIWCVRVDLTGFGKFSASSIWNDGGSSSHSNVSLWSIISNTIEINDFNKTLIGADTFLRTTRLHIARFTSITILLLLIENQYEKFDAFMPEITPNKISSKKRLV